jgi:hypothetical protein
MLFVVDMVWEGSGGGVPGVSCVMVPTCPECCNRVAMAAMRACICAHIVKRIGLAMNASWMILLCR